MRGVWLENLRLQREHIPRKVLSTDGDIAFAKTPDKIRQDARISGHSTVRSEVLPNVVYDIGNALNTPVDVCIFDYTLSTL